MRFSLLPITLVVNSEKPGETSATGVDSLPDSAVEVNFSRVLIPDGLKF
ncbi:hypothetical protein KUC_0198 [Vreelandella boliviensis LC1]|uniref:Uncharacterized protein n=1 Tax=Vreelandella boliviensis LC1 TaxID=1072583 RepID=A0A7U9C502_9GAMM|nr:hypothetical protein KUC_0198 [Halomonas boliviensis LC1]